jgi:predicted phage-related endonuclease
MKIACDNAAFFTDAGQYYPQPELARIFGELVRRVKAMDNRSECRYPITDVNGNLVGEAKIT